MSSLCHSLPNRSSRKQVRHWRISRFQPPRLLPQRRQCAPREPQTYHDKPGHTLPVRLRDCHQSHGSARAVQSRPTLLELLKVKDSYNILLHFLDTINLTSNASNVDLLTVVATMDYAIMEAATVLGRDDVMDSKDALYETYTAQDHERITTALTVGINSTEDFSVHCTPDTGPIHARNINRLLSSPNHVSHERRRKIPIICTATAST